MADLKKLKDMRSLLQSEMKKSESFSLVLNKTSLKLEEINHKVMSLETEVKKEKWRSSLFSDQISHTIAPISATLRVLSSVHDLERSLFLSSPRSCLLTYVSDVKHLEEVIKLLSSSCVLALQWLEDTIEFLDNNGMPEDHPCRLRFKSSIKFLQDLEMNKGEMISTPLEKLEKEFQRILEEDSSVDVLSKKLTIIVQTLKDHKKLSKSLSFYIKFRRKIIKKWFEVCEIDFEKITITEADTVQEISGLVDQWRIQIETSVKEVYEVESKLCSEVFKDVQEEFIFGEIASRSGILNLLRFGLRICKCKKDPLKLFKLLDVFSTMDTLRSEFNKLFTGESCSEIRKVTRELIQSLVNGVSEIFWELTYQVQLQRPNCPPLESGVPKLVKVVTDYCNQLLDNNNRQILSKILEIDMNWRHEKYQEKLLIGQIYNVLREIALNLDSWSSSNTETTVSCIFMMNSHSHFCSLRDSNLGKLMGDSWLTAHEHYRDYYAGVYVKESCGKLLSKLNNKAQNVTVSSSIKVRLQGFCETFDEMCEKELNWIVEDEKMRLKICQAMVKSVVPRYKSCLEILVAENPWSSDEEVKYTVKGLEMKMKRKFKRESHYRKSKFVHKVMDSVINQNTKLTLEAI